MYFSGWGWRLLGLIQKMAQGSATGLESFIYGKTASMVFDDFVSDLLGRRGHHVDRLRLAPVQRTHTPLL